MRKRWLGIAGLFCFSCCGFGQDLLDLLPDQPGALICWTEARSAPRLLRIHYLKAALNAPGLQIVSLPGDDPDGPGPAESKLTPPTELFTKFHVLAAVNANAFAPLAGDPGNIPNWVEGLPVNIQGMVISAGKTISPNESGRMPFWVDAFQRPRIGAPAATEKAAEAVADWNSPLLMDSRVIPKPEDRILHPRTALGFDESGAWLLLVVVDGRQPGFSEGVSLYELADILRSHGCSQAINLDGGGSSIMLVREPGKEVRTVNSPSGKSHRPIPVMLGIRKAALP
jgi:hypothetical protein